MTLDVLQRTDAEAAAELAWRIQAGDRSAESELVERYSRGLLFQLRRLAGNPAWSEDLHQEAFRIVLEKLRRGEVAEPEKLGGFLLGVARNLHRDDFRKRTRRGEGQEGEAFDSPDPAPGQLAQVLREEEAGLVREVIGELGGDRDRELLLRFYVAEEDKETICADLDLSPLHFNRVLFRARQRLKELLERRGARR